MAKRYGGKYSPDAPETDDAPVVPENSFRGRPAARQPFGAKALFYLPIPLVFSGLSELRNGDVLGASIEWAAAALLLVGAWLLSEGLKAEEAYDRRKIARAPAFPRKIFAAASCGLGVALAAGAGRFDLGLIEAGGFGALAALAHLLGYGIDPMTKKGLEGQNAFETERVAKAIDKAEAVVAETLGAARRIGDRGLEARVERLAATARDMFRTVEDDPRDLPRARKFMTVYLAGARDATVKFAEFYSRTGDADARAKYEALLDDLEGSFAAHRERLLMDNRTDLDVEIEVLQDRLKQEGIVAR